MGARKVTMAIERKSMAETNTEVKVPVPGVIEKSFTDEPDFKLDPDRRPLNLAADLDLPPFYRPDAQVNTTGRGRGGTTGDGGGRDDGGGGGNGPEGSRNPDIEPDPDKITLRMQILSVKAEKGKVSEEEIEEYARLGKDLTRYANDKQIFKEDHEISAEKKKLDDFDQREINSKSTEEEKEVLKNLLNDLDRVSRKWKREDNTYKLYSNDKSRPLFIEEQWGEIKKELDALAEEKTNLEQDIRGRTSQGFLQRRIGEQRSIQEGIERINEESKKEKDADRRKRLAQPEAAWEKEREEILIRGRRIDLSPQDLANNRYIQLPAQDILIFIRNNQNSPDKGKAEEALEWKIQEAERLGIFHDLEQAIKLDYQLYTENLFPPTADPREQRVRGRSNPRPLIHIRRDIYAKFNNPRIDENIDTAAEEPAEWSDVVKERRLSEDQMKEFMGIRGEFVRRAYKNMQDSLTNLSHLKERLDLQTELMMEKITTAEYDEGVAKIAQDSLTEIPLSSEWNVHKLEKVVRERLEGEALAEGSKRLFDENYFQIELFGQDRKEVELGAEQAAESIINSASTFSIQVIQERRTILLRAIEERRDVLKVSGNLSDSEAKELVKQIQRSVTNKLDFYLLHWLAQALRMDDYSSYFEQTMMMDGPERLKIIPAMNDGLVGLALFYLHKDEYKLFFKPGGFRNQLGESDAQTYLRDKLKERLIETLMLFELSDGQDEKRRDLEEKHSQGAITVEEYNKGLEEIENAVKQGRADTLSSLTNVSSTEEFYQKFRENKISNPQKRKDDANAKYKQLFDKVNNARSAGQQVTEEDLEALNSAKRELAFEEHRFDRAKNMVTNAVDNAIKIMDIFGESSRLGAPSVIMDNGDHLGVKDITIFYQAALMQASQYGVIDADKKKYFVVDSKAAIRNRAKEWISRWRNNTYDRHTTDRSFKMPLKNGREMSVSLQPGFEETGLTTTQFKAIQDAAKNLRENGFNAKLKIKRVERGKIIEEELSFSEVINRQEFKSLKSNFSADYKSARDQKDDPYVIAQAAKGRIETIRNFRTRAGLEGVEEIGGNDHEVLYKYTQLIEDSRALDAELERLVYYEAVYGKLEKVTKVGTVDRNGKKIVQYHTPTLSFNRLDYGYQGLPWGIKRLQHLKAFWYANINARISRGADMIWCMPTSLDSLSQESNEDNILDMFWDLNKLQDHDNWTLMTFAQRTADQAFARGKTEGDIVKEGAGMDKDWGYNEKLTADSNALRKFFKRGAFGPLKLRKNLREYDPAEKEELVNALQNVFLSRLKHWVVATEKQLALDRQALGSGAGVEENEKLALRFLEWLLSEKEEGNTREEGGLINNKEIREIILLITTPNSYGAGSSIWDEVWRKFIPSHNPRLDKARIEPAYYQLAPAA